MTGERKASKGSLISNRFAVIVIAILFGASLVGWIASEIVPFDFPARADSFREAWGKTAVAFITAMRLYDPFHSFWYRIVLAIFLAVLLLCIVSRRRQLSLRSWRPALPASSGDLGAKRLSIEHSWRSLAAGGPGAKDPVAHYAERFGRAEPVDAGELRGFFARIAALFRKRGYRVDYRESEAGIAFAASTGRLRSPGTMLFHAGILIITIGGIVGSYAGWREMVLVKEGTAVPFPRRSDLTLRVDDFEIVLTERREIRSFVSTVAVTDERGNAIGFGRVEVNHPMNVAGCRIYQSEYTIDESEFSWARVEFALRGTFRRGSLDLAAGAPPATVDSALTVRALRYLPDFRMGSEGAFSASSHPANPAIEVEIARGEETERGWLFLYHREFNRRFDAPVDFALTYCEPVYYTGLEVSANPGAGVLIAGFVAASLGLLFMYGCTPRVVRGFARPDGIVVAAGEHRWKASFAREFAEIDEAIRAEFEKGGRPS